MAFVAGWREGQAGQLQQQTVEPFVSRQTRPEPQFNIASVGKMFTAVALAQQIEAGRLTFDMPVGTVLPDCPSARVRDSVSVRMLLSHRSGISNVVPTRPLPRITLDSHLAQLQHLPLDCPADSTSSHSNSNYLLLGRMLERLTGTTCWTHINASIFRPARMSTTRPCDAWRDTPHLALGYTYDRLEGPPSDTLWNTSQMVGTSSPADGGCASSRDLLRIMSALRRGWLLRPETLRTMTQVSAHFGNVGGRAYRLGFEQVQAGGERACGHARGHPDITAYVMHFPHSGYTVIAISNRDREASRLGGWIAMLIGDTVAG